MFTVAEVAPETVASVALAVVAAPDAVVSETVIVVPSGIEVAATTTAMGFVGGFVVGSWTSTMPVMPR